MGLLEIEVRTVEEPSDLVYGGPTAGGARPRLKTSYRIIPSKLFTRRGFMLDYSSSLTLSKSNLRRLPMEIDGGSPL